MALLLDFLLQVLEEVRLLDLLLLQGQPEPERSEVLAFIASLESQIVEK